MLTHNLITTRKLIAVCPLLLFMGTRTGAADRFMVPTPVPAPTIQPFVPVGEKLFYELSTTVIPGTRHWVLWREGGLMHYNTTQSVGDGSAMYVYLPAGAKSGWLTAYDTGVQPVKNKEGQVTQDDLRQYKGLCLWIKGDGSDAAAVFTNNSGYSKNRFRVPLKDTNWHKVFMPWDKWQEPITGYWWFLTYGLERKNQSKDNWYIVDRIHLYKEEKTEPIQPTPDNDPPGMVPAKAFVSGREHIARTLAKLKAKQPVKIVVAGDSIVTCAQLWYVRDDWSKPASDTYPYAYWWVLGQRLRDAYGYEKVGCMLRTWDDKEKKWKDTVGERPKAELQVIAVATGGWTTKHGLEHLEQVLGEKPDLVIWEYGGNDGINGSLDQYVKCTEEAVSRLRAAGCEVVVQSMTTSVDLLPKAWLKNASTYEFLGELSKHSRRIAKEKDCALADMYAALSCRGIQFVGDLHSDFVHLNHYGHEMFAEVLEALLTDRDVRIWKHGPATRKTVLSATSQSKRILFLGNSITLHGPAPEIGWTGNWGMAASAREKDYVHVLANSIARRSGSQPEVRIDNIADFERHYDAYDLETKLKGHLDFKPDMVIVAIGENIPALASEDAKTKFKASFTKLLSALKCNGQPAIFVRSCFWADKIKDEIMRQACLAVGGVFVDIGGLGKVESNYARSERTFAHSGVAAHPGDEGMQAIADALLKAVTSQATEEQRNAERAARP